MHDLYLAPRNVHTRWASPENPSAEPGNATAGSDGRKRRPCVPLKAGQSLTLAEYSGGPGIVRRIWITIGERSAKMLRGMRIDMYWDGAAKPAVSAPLGDFFGHMLGRMATFQSALFSSPEGRSFNCCIPMPFRKAMKIVLTNETDADQGSVYYDVDFTVGDELPADALYFHAHWRRENPTQEKVDYAMLPAVAGCGRYLGAHIGVKADTKQWVKCWWGEGEVKVYLDGDTALPTLCGTGTEDFIGTGWGQGQYANLYQGCHLADHDKYQYSFYRLHLPDPVYFHKSIRVTIQQIGCWDPNTIASLHGLGRTLHLGDDAVDMVDAVAKNAYGLFERTDDWSSCAYFYLDRPESSLPDLAAVAERLA